MSKTLLLTGASGYIAGHLIPALKDQAGTLIGVDRRQEVPEGIDSFVQGDLCDPQVARKAVAGTDQILHLATARADWGLSEEEYYRDNLDATRTLIEAGRKEGVTDWVFYSTVSVMGPSREPLSEARDSTPSSRTEHPRPRPNNASVSWPQTIPRRACWSFALPPSMGRGTRRTRTSIG